METWVILAALEQELVPVARALGLARSREDRQLFSKHDDKREIEARYTGMGQDATRIGLEKAVKNRSVTRLLHVGFAGGLAPSLKPGDLITPRWIVHDSGRVMLLNGSVPSMTTSQVHQRKENQTLLTSDALADSVSIKKDLHHQFQAAAVEMECFHLALLASQKQLNLTVIRAISDPADMALPREVMQWVHDDGSSNTPAAIGYLARKPWKLPLLLKLGNHAGKASRALVAAACQWVREGENISSPNGNEMKP